MTGPQSPLDPQTWLSFVKDIGVPSVILLVVLLQVIPRVDRGIQIADRVDSTLVLVSAQLQRCGP